MDTLTFIIGALGQLDRMQVLDVGCGRGALAKALVKHGAQVVGVDPNSSVITAARDNVPSARFEVASAEALPFPANSFEGVVCLNALHHADDPGKALNEMARVVAPAGCIIVIEPLAEGTFFEVLRPIEDETAVRAKAQAAIKQVIADHSLVCERNVRLERLETFGSVDEVVERIVAVDPTRNRAATMHRCTVEATFMAVIPDKTGRRTLSQPLQAHVLCARKAQ